MGMTAGISARLNQLAAVATLAGQMGGGGYATVAGLDLSAAGGLNLAVSPGIALLDGWLELLASGGVAPVAPFQATLPACVTLPASAMTTLWMNGVGTVLWSATLVPPSGGKLFLGTVATSGTAVTSIDYSGRIWLQGGEFTRTTADLFAPGDSPPASIRLQTTTGFGQYYWDGSSHKALLDPGKHLIRPYQAQTLTGDLILAATAPNVQSLDPAGATRTVTLPSAASVTLGHHFTLIHSGTSGSLAIKTATGSTLATLSAGNQVDIAPMLAAGVLAWPASVTPIATI